jgi:hypothetical protein
MGAATSSAIAELFVEVHTRSVQLVAEAKEQTARAHEMRALTLETRRLVHEQRFARRNGKPS